MFKLTHLVLQAESEKYFQNTGESQILRPPDFVLESFIFE